MKIGRQINDFKYQFITIKLTVKSEFYKENQLNYS